MPASVSSSGSRPTSPSASAPTATPSCGGCSKNYWADTGPRPAATPPAHRSPSELRLVLWVVSSPDPRKTREVRPEIQALRAFAVLVVVIYHVWPERLTGGFT